MPRLLPALLVSTALASAAGAQPLHHGAKAYNPDLYAEQPAPGSFARMFDLERFGLDPHPSPIYDLRRLGAEGGPMQEAADDPVDDSRIEAGITFLGQFVDHDITLDVTSSLERRAIPAETPNQRTPDLDLDCVYGAGREATPWLYDGPYLVVGAPILGGDRHDLARVPATGVALIGDPRNDENFILSQVQAAFIAFHNRFVTEILSGRLVAEGVIANPTDDPDAIKAALAQLSGSPDSAENALAAELGEAAFEAARDHTIHYYHRMLVEYFLPKVIGLGRTIDIATNGRRFYLEPLTEPESEGGGLVIRDPNMPVEFAAAAYRFGHSQVRQTYTLTATGEPMDLFREGVQNGFVPVTDGSGGSRDLVIDFGQFFPIPGRADMPQTTRRIDPRLPAGLFMLDRVGVVPPGGLGSLAARNLNRGRTFRLPPGEALFRTVALPPIEEGEILEVEPGGRGVLRLGRRGAAPGPEAKLEGMAVQVALKPDPRYQLTALAPEGQGLESAPAGGPRALDAGDERLQPFLEASEEVRSVLGLPATPLWYYVLEEAANWPVTFGETPDSNHVWPVELYIQESVAYLAENLTENRTAYGKGGALPRSTGQILGPVGGTIVGEVIIGLLDHYREKTGKGLDYVTEIEVPLTELEGFGPRMTFGDMIVFIGWDAPLNP